MARLPGLGAGSSSVACSLVAVLGCDGTFRGTGAYRPEAMAEDRVGDRAAGQRHEQSDRLVEQDGGDRGVVVDAVDDQHRRDAADRADAGRAGESIRRARR